MTDKTNLPKFSPSSIAAYLTCPVSWKYNYIDGLHVKGTRQYFEIGTYTHELFHVYYHMIQAGAHIGSDAILIAMKKRMESDLKNLTPTNGQLYLTVFKLVQDFITRQSPKIDPGMNILGVEYNLDYEVTTPHGNRVILQGIIDLFYSTLRRDVVVRDHKTGQQNNYSANKILLNPQLLFYAAVLHAMGYKVSRVEISYANSYPYKDRSKKAFEDLFQLIQVPVSSQYLDNFWAKILTIIDKILEEPPMNAYGQACNSCNYAQLCQMELRGQDATKLIEGTYERKDRDYAIPVTWLPKPTKVSEEHPNTDGANSLSFSGFGRRD